MGSVLSIHKACLNPHLSLRTQMFLSFGLTAVIAISSFVLIGMYTTSNSGQSVRQEASVVLEEAIRYSLGWTAQYVAQTMAKKFSNIGEAGSIIAEATKDRFVGYPSMEGWAEDRYVPFLDTESGLNIYPLNADPLPLEWNLTGNVNPTNFAEHMPYRTLDMYTSGANISSVNAAYFMQGMCDPTQKNPGHPSYHPDCTEENNNLFVGGAVQPTDTNYYIADKSKDLAWVLKPIYEAHYDVMLVGMYFANDGAGSTVVYPATSRDGRATFTSIGCDWMRQINPRTNRFIGTPEQIRRCHPAGRTQTMRQYNPLERGWCQKQVERDVAIQKGKASSDLMGIYSTGPYLNPAAVENVWVMTFGQAVFDRLTGEFIACTLLDVSAGLLYDILYNTTANTNSTLESALIRWDEEGNVVVASSWNPNNETTATTVTDPKLGLGVDVETYDQMRSLVDYNLVWDPFETVELYRRTMFSNEGRLIMTHPVPSVPDEYDPLYHPVYFIVISLEEHEAYEVLDQMDVLITSDVRSSGKQIIWVGATGFGVILLSVAFISRILTKPLRWMQKVAGKIVDNAGGHDLRMGLPDEDDAADAKPLCSPRTEVTLLLAEFVKMLNDFSGDGAADVAGGNICEVKNKFEWKKMYTDLYAWGENDGDEIDPFSADMDGFNPLSIPHGKSNETFDDEETIDTLRTDRSFLSILTESLPAEYAPAVENAVSQTRNLLTSVKEYAVVAGTKTGLLAQAPPEKVEGPPKLHVGENIVRPTDSLGDYFEGVDSADNSYLFWWTTFCIGTPIVISAIMIAVTVVSDAAINIPFWLSDVKIRTIDIELEALLSATRTRAAFGEEVMHRFARDLHVYTRVAGWLFLGSLRRADSFTFQTSGAEECKLYPSDACPHKADATKTACLCEWDDGWGYNCSSLNETLSTTMGNPFNISSNTTFNREDPRYWQHRWFECSSSDANELTGDRFKTSYPAVDFSPETTNWWNDTSTMPGAYKGSSAAGYDTTYDRVRVLSALSVADFPIYNYHVGPGEQRMLGTYMGLEADGMFTGFSGCESYAGVPHFQSNENNSAYTVNSTLCPKGRYSFDCRCRGWYTSCYAERGFIHVTSPYAFASSDTVGMSAGAAIIDPQNQEHIGEMLIDFIPSSFISAVQGQRTAIGQGRTGFPIIITPQPDVSGTDTLAGPNFKEGEETAFIGALVLPFDHANSSNRQHFDENVVERMRRGDTYFSSFTRTTVKGDQEELYMTYAPVKLRSLRAINHADFSAGVEAREAPVYALGFGISVKDLAIAFEQVEDKVNNDIAQVSYISLALIVGALLMVMYMTYTMTIYLAQPILCLVGIVKSISDKTLGDELPELQGGSCEIHDVYDSLEKLCKIVRFSNSAFFKGDRTQSYRVLQDALELFENMGNQKALGVANNNLGTMVLQEQMEKSSTTSRSEEVYRRGIKHFDEAIRIGTYEYQNADWDDARGEFVKQLANRYFNRGMFYIVNRQTGGDDAEAQGIKDLDRAKSLDQEAYLYTRERGQTVQQARSEFFCVLRRARGMLKLIQETDFKDVWGIEDVIEQAHDLIHNPAFSDSSLFENVNLVARKQEVLDLRIQHALSKGEVQEAAKMAMKILVEDEYVIDTVLMNCVTTLNKHYDLQAEEQVPNLAEGLRKETRRGQVDSMRQAKNVVFCLDYSGSMAGARMRRANSNLLWVYEEHCQDKDFVGFCRFNHAVDETLYFDLERKGGKQEEHLEIIGKALDAEGGTRLYAALNKCVSMSLASGNTYDTWIIALTDGESAWDFPAKQVISRIEKNNKKEGPKMHVIIIGFEVPPEVADSVEIITRITDKSLYIDAKGGLDEMDNAFEQVASVITGTAITMETF